MAGDGAGGRVEVETAHFDGAARGLNSGMLLRRTDRTRSTSSRGENGLVT